MEARTTLWSSNSVTGYLPEENENTALKRDKHFCLVPRDVRQVFSLRGRPASKALRLTGRQNFQTGLVGLFLAQEGEK